MWQWSFEGEEVFWRLKPLMVIEALNVCPAMLGTSYRFSCTPLMFTSLDSSELRLEVKAEFMVWNAQDWNVWRSTSSGSCLLRKLQFACARDVSCSERRKSKWIVYTVLHSRSCTIEQRVGGALVVVRCGLGNRRPVSVGHFRKDNYHNCCGVWFDFHQ